jgi:hypothetical protein
MMHVMETFPSGRAIVPVFRILLTLSLRFDPVNAQTSGRVPKVFEQVV